MWKKQVYEVCRKIWTCKGRTAQRLNLFHYYCTQRSALKLGMHINGVCIDNYILALEKQYIAYKTVKLKPIALILKNRRTIISQIENLDELLIGDDVDMVKLASEEKMSYAKDLNITESALLDAVLTFCWNESESDISKSCSMTLEVSAGVGGQEAMLFASELFDMYRRFVLHMSWDHYVADEQRSDLGGIRHGTIIIQHAEALNYLQYEAGVHRVQRIPATEKSGRVHTSTVSVIALRQPTHIQIEVQPTDLKIETKRATGAGGQHVNTTDSAVRIVHIPTGVVVECQTDRSQIRNKQIALQRLRTKLNDLHTRTQHEQTQAIRSSQVPSSSRNQKIRTYNYSKDRITDHRLQAVPNSNIHNLKVFMLNGEHLEHLIDKIRATVKLDALLQAVSEYHSQNNNQ